MTETAVFEKTHVIDAAHSRLGFRARHAMVTNVRGQFTDFSGEAKVDRENPAASAVAVTIQAASIDTGSADRDGHLRSADFFDAEEFPTLTFVSTAVSKDGDDWSITGDLTIKDVTKSVTIEFEETGTATDPFGNVRTGFEGSVNISRKEWGLTWNAALEAGGVLVSDKIKLDLDISAISA
jgi:polyisoprenoid-binding protein YceI